MPPDELSGVLAKGEEAFKSYDYHSSLGHFKNALNIVDRMSHSYQKEKLRTDIMFWIVDVHERSGKWLDALMYVETLANLARARGDQRLEVRAELKGGGILLKRGSWREALKRFKRLQDRVDKHGTPGQRGECLMGIANAEWRLGNNQEAKILAQKAVALEREAKDAGLEGRALILQASILHDMGEFDNSIRLFRESIELLRGIGDTVDLARAYNNLGEVYKAQGDYELASKQYDLCVEVAISSNNVRSEVYGLTNAAECMARLGKLEGAKERLVRIDELLESMEDEYVLANTLFVKGLVAFGERDEEVMHREFKRAIEIIDRLETAYDMGVFTYEYAMCLISLGNKSEAEALLRKSRASLERANARRYLEKVALAESRLRSP